MFDPLAFQSLRRGNWGSALEWHPTLESTQDAARDRVRHVGVETGFVIGAEQQSAGRGRWGRRWEDTPGQSLLFTVAVPATDLNGHLSQAPLVVGLGLLRGLERLGMKGLALRWPNDLTLKGRKLAGLLLEQEGGHMLIGLGLNVGQDEGAFSPEIQDKAVSLRLAGSPELRREPLLAALLDGMETAWGLWQERGFEPLRKAWEQAAEGKDALLKVQPTAGEAWQGRWAGLHESGALQLQPESGPVRLLVSGELERLHFP